MVVKTKTKLYFVKLDSIEGYEKKIILYKKSFLCAIM